MPSEVFEKIASWSNLLEAYRSAAAGKRTRRGAAAFEYRVADRVIELQADLLSGAYRPGPYRNFKIHEPKPRTISAAAFRDRVVHHALCKVIEPRFERRFIADSFANRTGKGTHRALDRFQQLARRHGYVLRGDVVQHFASIDHTILRSTLARVIPEADVMLLVETIVASGEGVLEDEYRMVWFPGDDLLAACRPRGLPIGNLTSQFWSNCYLDPLDQFVKRKLRCPGYLRYVDDFALFADSKRQLWDWKCAIVEYLEGLRLVLHERAAQVTPVAHGTPWLGFVVFPTHRKLKARNVRLFTRRLDRRWLEFCDGEISFAELTAGVRGWVEHARHGDTWGLREHVLGRALRRPP